MLKTVRGIFRNGRVELTEPAPDVRESRVLITFLGASGPLDLGERGIDRQQAADLRGRLRAIGDDWDSPEMDVYDEI